MVKKFDSWIVRSFLEFSKIEISDMKFLTLFNPSLVVAYWHPLNLTHNTQYQVDDQQSFYSSVKPYIGMRQSKSLIY